MTASIRRKLLWILLAVSIAWGIYSLRAPSHPRSADPYPSALIADSATVDTPPLRLDTALYRRLAWGDDPFRR